jgi:dTDP-4-dehydrorhamnose 3,5-epimerase
VDYNISVGLVFRNAEHGFLVLSDVADFEYKCTDYYDPSDEGSLRWNDTYLNIDWPTKKPLLSTKDANAVLFSDLKLWRF